MLKLKIIACDVFNREISYLCSHSKCFTDVTFLHQGLHDTPNKLNTALQAEINKANEGFPYNHYNSSPSFDYIIIGYGLCSNGIVGITSENVPLVIPRAHDCITPLLGSKKSYKEFFDNNPGTYWFSTGWIERGWQPSELKYTTLLQKYIEKYGEDNAEYLMEMEQGWLKEYKLAAHITWDSLPNQDYYKDFTKKSADFLKWQYKEVKGDKTLLEKILNGEFNEEDVLVVPKGKRIVQSNDDMIISCL